MRRRMRKTFKLKLRRHEDRLIGLNKYLALFPGGKLSDKVGVMALNGVF